MADNIFLIKFIFAADGSREFFHILCNIATMYRNLLLGINRGIREIQYLNLWERVRPEIMINS
jgi:hypothetical protein